MTSRTSATVSLDAGQSGTKVRVSDADGILADRVLPGIGTHEPILPQLAEVVRSVAADAVVRPMTVTIGASGLTRAEADAGSLLALTEDLGIERIVLTHDSVTSFLGALGDRRGAVVAAGTGVVTLAVGAERVARVDGWGHIMGDAGSGYWIGREALDAVMRAHDGRGAPTALTEPVVRRWPDLEDAYIALQAMPDRVRAVAAFAGEVARLADADVVAADITRRAAAQLAASVATALERVASASERLATGGADAPVVSAVGGVFHGVRLREAFGEALAARVPEARIVSAVGTGLDGAVALARLGAGHPLDALVSIART